MTEKDLEEYLKKLKEFESELSSENDVDESFINEINDVLGSLLNDASRHDKRESFSSAIKVGVKKLHKYAVIPTYSKEGDAGMDLTITRRISNTSDEVTYGFGIAMEIPEGHVGLVFPRSSVRKYELSLTNCVGVIDSGYRGEIQATFRKHNGLDSIQYEVGDRGAQIMILPYPKIQMIEKDELSDTDRGEGGFGSTGN